MAYIFPAVMIGGPPNAGKSVLTYSLTHALRELNIDHYVIRAHPDGDGDWFQQIEPDQVRAIHVRGRWTDEFVQAICTALAHRHLPLLVDVGGLPTEEQKRMFLYCTHSLLLLRADKPEIADMWRQIAAQNGLLPLANLYSSLDGNLIINAESPVIEGVMTGLRRQTMASGPLFDLLVARLASLFAFDKRELQEIHFRLAPVELVIDLDMFVQRWSPQARRWQPDMLPRLLAELPSDTPLALYGRAPNWVYGALVCHTGQDAFYQYDARLGWVLPPPLQLDLSDMPELHNNIRIQSLQKELDASLERQEEITLVNMSLTSKYLDYMQTASLHFPSVSATRGLILSGAVPHWLLTALVRTYANTGVPWIACYQPQLQGATIVVSHTPMHIIGDVIALPASWAAFS